MLDIVCTPLFSLFPLSLLFRSFSHSTIHLHHPSPSPISISLYLSLWLQCFVTSCGMLCYVNVSYLFALLRPCLVSPGTEKTNGRYYWMRHCANNMLLLYHIFTIETICFPNVLTSKYIVRWWNQCLALDSSYLQYTHTHTHPHAHTPTSLSCYFASF